jgi:hypothetical protein
MIFLRFPAYSASIYKFTINNVDVDESSQATGAGRR